MNRFLKNNKGEITERIIILAIAVIVVLALFRFSVYIRCINNISLDQISAQVNDLLLVDSSENCKQIASSATPAGMNADGSITVNPDGTLSSDITSQIPPSTSTFIPTTYYNSSGVSVSCMASQSYYNFKIPDNATPQSTGTQTLVISNNTGWDMWIKITDVITFDGLKVSNVSNSFQSIPNGKQVYFKVGWLWDVTTTDTVNRGAATVYFQTSCSKPNESQIVYLPPEGPTNFKAVNITNTEATLTWNPPAAATKYEIWQSGRTLYAGTATQFSVSGLNPASGYAYSVRSGNDYGWSPYVSTSFVTTGQSLAPATPKNFRVISNSDDSITFGWDVVPGTTSYTLAKVWGTIYTGPDNTFTVKGLKPGSGTWYELKGTNANGESGWVSLYAYAGISGNSPIPAVAQNFKVISVTNSTITVTWDPVAKADSYYINVGQWNGARVYTGTNTSATIAGLIPGTTYGFYLFAKNSTATSDQAYVGGTTSGISPLPGTPINFKAASATNTSISLQWTPVSNASYYTITRNGVALYTGSNTSFTATGLTINSSYLYSIQAFNSFGKSGYANLQTSTTNISYDNTSNISDTCQINSFDQTFVFPTSLKPGISGIFEVDFNNPSNQNLIISIESIEKNGSLFDGSTPVVLEFYSSPKTVTAGTSLKVPIKWTLPSNAGIEYSSATGSIIVHIKTSC